MVKGAEADVDPEVGLQDSSSDLEASVGARSDSESEELGFDNDQEGKKAAKTPAISRCPFKKVIIIILF